MKLIIRRRLERPEAPTASAARRWRPGWKWLAACGALGVITAAVLYWGARPDPASFAPYPPATRLTADPGLTTDPSLTPDGSRLVFASTRGNATGRLSLWVRQLESGQVRRLTGESTGDSEPDLSPDGNWVAFHSERDGGGVYVIPLNGQGAVRRVAPNGWRPRFSPDGKWIAYFDLLPGTKQAEKETGARLSAGRLFLAPALGGEPVRLRADFRMARFPVWTPDSRRVIFEGVSFDGIADWWVTSIDAGEAIRTGAFDALRIEVPSRGRPELYRDGFLYFTGASDSRTQVWRLALGPAWEAAGAPQRVTDHPGGADRPAMAHDQTLYFTEIRDSTEAWSLSVDADEVSVKGSLERLTNDHGKVRLPTLSADGRRLAYVSDRTGTPDVWLRTLATGVEDRLTNARQIHHRPMLSFDGTQVALPTIDDDGCVIAIASTVRFMRTATVGLCAATWDWSADGRRMLTFDPDRTPKTVDLATPQKRWTVLEHPRLGVYAAQFSPDGRWVSFLAGVTALEAKGYLAALPARDKAISPEAWIPIPGARGGNPAWAPGGRVVYFESDRDGFDCLWAIRLDARMRPIGEPAPIVHFHSPEFGVGGIPLTEFHLSVSADRLVFNAATAGGNLWRTRRKRW